MPVTGSIWIPRQAFLGDYSRKCPDIPGRSPRTSCSMRIASRRAHLARGCMYNEFSDTGGLIFWSAAVGKRRTC